MEKDSTPVMLARFATHLDAIQMRLQSIDEDLKTLVDQRIELMTVKTSVEFLQQENNKLQERLTRDFVKREKFEPLQKIVYGAVALIGASVLISLLSLLKLSH